MRARVLLFALLLAAVIVPASPALAGGGRCHTPYTDESGTEVITEGSCFRPMVLRAQPGDTVTWSVSDGIAHNVITPLPFGGDLPVGQTHAARFDEPGVYPYACTLHPGMLGVIVVGDGVATAVSAATSGLDAAQLPPVSARDELLWITLAVSVALLALLGAAARKTRPGPQPSQQ